LLTINLLGGGAVLGSYAYGMFLAAAGYFAFIHFILFRLQPASARLGDRFGFGAFNILFAAILIPSALWMPLTYAAAEASNMVLLWVVRLVLAAVGLASLGLLAALLNTQPRRPLWAYRLAVIGCAAFCLQTAVLDMVVWSAYFTV
jgi:hypothetical protein